MVDLNKLAGETPSLIIILIITAHAQMRDFRRSLLDELRGLHGPRPGGADPAGGGPGGDRAEFGGRPAAAATEILKEIGLLRHEMREVCV